MRKRLGSMYLTLETRKDGVKFTNGKLRRLSDLHCQLSENYGQVQKDLVAKVVEVASTFVEVCHSQIQRDVFQKMEKIC